jgi:DNA-binding winged helix-turn-helix (wHTH) protein
MTEQKGPIFRFGEFEVREREFCLLRGEETIPVEPKAFRVLLYLLHNPHRLVTKDELLDAVWQATSVSENSLTRAVAMLRRLLGDDTREPRFIATVPTAGYRFVSPVRVSDSGGPGPLEQKPELQRKFSFARRHTTLLLSSGGAAVLLLVLFMTIDRHHADRHSSASAAAFPTGHSYVLLSVHGSMSEPMLSPDARPFFTTTRSAGS